MWFMIKVTFGEHDRCKDKPPETRFVARAFMGNFSFLNFDNDIALLRLSEKISLTENIRPVCLPKIKGETDRIANGVIFFFFLVKYLHLLLCIY